MARSCSNAVSGVPRRGLGGVWVALAWSLAVSEVSTAIARHERFGLVTSLAFLIAISMPMIQARRAIAGARGAIAVLRRIAGPPPKPIANGRDEASKVAGPLSRDGRPLQ